MIFDLPVRKFLKYNHFLHNNHYSIIDLVNLINSVSSHLSISKGVIIKACNLLPLLGVLVSCDFGACFTFSSIIDTPRVCGSARRYPWGSYWPERVSHAFQALTNHVPGLANGLQRPTSGLQRLAFDVQRFTSGLQSDAFEAQRSANGLQGDAFEVQRSTNVFQCFTLVFQRSANGVQRPTRR